MILIYFLEKVKSHFKQLFKVLVLQKKIRVVIFFGIHVVLIENNF